MMDDKIKKLASLIDESKNAVALTGAGISTASGIPDFRSNTGLYSANADYETMLSIGYFNQNPDEFYRFFKSNMIFEGARPNFAHEYLAQLENECLKAVITQNIDRLHTAAGSKNVIEVHGNLFEYTCTRCFHKTDVHEIMSQSKTPTCSKCGGVYRPDIVFYGEQLNEQNITRSINYVEQCDLLLVIGTSLVVYPVAGFVRYIRPEAKLVIINRDKTAFDSYADLVINDDIVSVFESVSKLRKS